MSPNASSNNNTSAENASTGHPSSPAVDNTSALIDDNLNSIDDDNRSDAASISSMPDLESVSAGSSSDSESNSDSDSDDSVPDLVPVSSDMEIASQRPVIPVHAGGLGPHSLSRVTQALSAMNLNPHGRRFRTANRQDIIRRSAPNGTFSHMRGGRMNPWFRRVYGDLAHRAFEGAIQHRADFPVYIHNYRRGVARYNPNRVRAPNPQGGVIAELIRRLQRLEHALQNLTEEERDWFNRQF
ncbi:hypothetical protein R3P38DRAFT_3262936 [Favolaschia claudopus]|uniref:Uncharacterized protein n=1 Tax=Favolaschia claudopus TaxID=2862362 RepID=A0AAW0CK59_9AGAR